MEFERLISYFDADIKPLEKAVGRGIELVDTLEKRFKKLKTDLKLNLTTGNATREM
ncbi:MAG TPA: hypothetical protein VK468_10035 [Pyrinomonadaceae bacterium]|nr:hypothetical protein [Pyrinomonadaceae bacterium]